MRLQVQLNQVIKLLNGKSVIIRNYKNAPKNWPLRVDKVSKDRGLTAMSAITLTKSQCGSSSISRACRRQYGRSRVGAAIAELGPAMWVLLFGFFFPVLVLVSMLCTYGSILVLNNFQVHEAALLPSESAQDPNGAILKTIPGDWQNAGLGRFVRLQGFPDTSVNYKPGQTDQNGVKDQYVLVTTTCTVAPLVPVPFLITVPGLNAPWTFTVSSECLVENQDNAP